MDELTKTPVYVSSKRMHLGMWQSWKKKGNNIISSWIDAAGTHDVEDIGKQLWPVWLSEASKAPYLIFYSKPGDVNHSASLLEIGASLAGGNIVLSVGVSEIMKVAGGDLADYTYHPNWWRCLNLDEAFKIVAERTTMAELLSRIA
jgi:hypothetical protein